MAIGIAGRLAAGVMLRVTGIEAGTGLEKRLVKIKKAC
jgi:hypothetical protein